MPRKPMSGRRLGDLTTDLSVAALLRVVSVKQVKQALRETDAEGERIRLLPPVLVVYLVIMIGLQAQVSVQENLRMLLHSLRLRFGQGRLKVAGGTAISFARRRLGVRPMAWLFAKVAQPLARTAHPDCFWKTLRPMAVDGTSAAVSCTKLNCERFGRPKNQHGQAGYPQVKIVVLLECATRAVVGWTMGASDDDEKTLAESLWDRLTPDMLLMADRAFYSFHRWRDCSGRCGALLWRVRNDLKPERLQALADGSYLALIRPSQKLIRRRLARSDESMTVRVIEYQAVMADDSLGERVRLFTDLLDPEVASAEELAALYPHRWPVETGFDELKSHLRGPERVLRSQRPELVEQEIHGFLLAHYIVRATMYEAAARDGCPPREMSFTHAVHVIRRHTADFPPSGPVAPNS